MPKKLKILVSAYACSPNRGSEPGMGWNFVLGLSKYHEVHVITETVKWKSEIEAYLEDHPELSKNLKFFYIAKKRNKKLRKIWPPSYYWFYKDWQKKTFQFALKLEKKENFDLIHQLNMVGFREPGYLWKVNKPFVWGPIGGLENSPWKFLPSLGLKGFIFYTGRNLFNSFQRNFSSRAKRAAQREKSTLIAATPSNQELMKILWNVQSKIICEVGQENIKQLQPEKRVKEPLKIIWSGYHTPGKNLPLLLNSLREATFPYQLNILGTGEMTEKWKNTAQETGIDKNCIWHGWLEREKAIEVMREGHVFCITSISDLTSTVTLEALSFGLPIICLDHCGFAHVVNESCGIKIPVDTPKTAAIHIEKALANLYNDEKERQRLSLGAILRAKDFAWDRKIDELNSIYSELLQQ